MCYTFRAVQWAVEIGRQDLTKLSAECLHRYYFVCARHFVPTMMNANKARLLQNAMPTHAFCDTNSVNSTANDNERISYVLNATELSGIYMYVSSSYQIILR